jgi:hypothetical protein
LRVTARTRRIKGDFEVTSRAALLRGGESGEPAVRPGDPDASPLFRSITWADLEMPPKENDRLSEKQVAAVKRWIQLGAPWVEAPRRKELAESVRAASKTHGVRMSTSGGMNEGWNERLYDPQDVWAYRPVPKVKAPGPGHPVDAFLNKAMRDKGVVPAPAADRRTLIRRITLDLTGLLPDPERVEAFVRDQRPDAYERLIDELLASPHYGEQMARRWLDIVRYADTSGYSNDVNRPNAWRYRDYVVRAFNQDKPFDRFAAEQIAGDEIAPNDREALIAVGFLRMAPWEHTGMAVAAETRQLMLEEMVNAVGTTFLATEMSCFKCHDHKFDPLPTGDYYRFQAIFAPVQPADRKVAFLESENTNFEFEKERYQSALKNLPGKKGGSKILRQRFDFMANRFEPSAFSIYNGSFREFDSRKPNQPMPKQPGDEVQQVRVLQGGSLASPGEVVKPAVLSPFGRSTDIDIPDAVTGRRAALAKWITRADHPLTARVLTNRIWQMHFGERGIVATPNQFGVMGAKPSHPQLLDYLARRFVEEGWSIKKLHRLILTSAAYRRSSTHPDAEKLAKIDPSGDLLAAYPGRRMAAEEIRDNLLLASGELNATLGGPPTHDQINWQAAVSKRRVQSGSDMLHRPSPRRIDRHRRSIYLQRKRGLAHPMLEVFNQPATSKPVEVRDQSTVTPQVFALFNGDFPRSRALAMAQRLIDQRANDASRVQRAFEVLYGRSPTADQQAACATYMSEALAHHRATKPEADQTADWLKQVSVKIDPDYPKQYEPEPHPSQFDAQTRALADLCLVLMNSSEFLYIR